VRPKVQTQIFLPRGQKYKPKIFCHTAKSANPKFFAIRPKVQTRNFLPYGQKYKPKNYKKDEKMNSVVASFNVDHDKLKRGLYVSRKDKVGSETLTTFDVRMKTPNAEPVLDTAAAHTLEHLLAVFLRGNAEWKDNVIYVGPMGCRTGMYLILAGDYESKDAIRVVRDAFKYVIDFSGKIPATTSAECGNYLDHDLTAAQLEAKKYYQEVLLKDYVGSY
jgi:S-ribosylhomocysteine lyase